MDLAAQIGSNIWYVVFGFVTGMVAIAGGRRWAHGLAEFLPYEMVQIRKPEKVAYYAVGGLYALQGYRLWDKRGEIPFDYVCFTMGLVFALTFFWIRFRPYLEHDAEGENAITFGEPWSK